MNAPDRRPAAEWVYRGIWGVVTRWFRVPDHPPLLPAHPGEQLHAFRPAPGFLRYLKFIFWVWLTVIDGLLLAAWIVLLASLPVAGLITAALMAAIIILPDIVAYIAIHLRYDTTWYILSPRSLRIRRGIWVIHETTITFENVQNVLITQGPLQRWFGIANLVVETAGGGAAEGGSHKSGPHRGLIEGIEDAPRIRELILAHAARSRSAGLGDEAPAPRPPTQWRPAHLRTLREIRDLALTLDRPR